MAQEQNKDQLPQWMQDAGYTLGKSSDELPAHGPQDSFYADWQAYQEMETAPQQQEDESADEVVGRVVAEHGTAFPSAGMPRALDRTDRDLLREMLRFLEDDGTFTDKGRRALTDDVQARLDEALSAATDDELSPEEMEAQNKGSW